MGTTYIPNNTRELNISDEDWKKLRERDEQIRLEKLARKKMSTTEALATIAAVGLFASGARRRRCGEIDCECCS